MRDMCDIVTRTVITDAERARRLADLERLGDAEQRADMWVQFYVSKPGQRKVRPDTPDDKTEVVDVAEARPAPDGPFTFSTEDLALLTPGSCGRRYRHGVSRAALYRANCNIANWRKEFRRAKAEQDYPRFLKARAKLQALFAQKVEWGIKEPGDSLPKAGPVDYRTRVTVDGIAAGELLERVTAALRAKGGRKFELGIRVKEVG